MPSTAIRRPIPALVALLALLLLTALVWWRVLNRSAATDTVGKGPCGSTSASSSGTGSPSPSRSTTSAPPPTKTLPAPADVTVKLQNSTKRQGIAGDAQQILIKDGFNAPGDATNDTKHAGKIKGVAEIRFGRSQADGAQLLHYYFPRARLVRTKSSKPFVIVSLGDKYKVPAGPTKVAAALKADGIAVPGLSGASPTPTKPTSTCGSGTTKSSPTTGTRPGTSTQSTPSRPTGNHSSTKRRSAHHR